MYDFIKEYAKIVNGGLDVIGHPIPKKAQKVADKGIAADIRQSPDALFRYIAVGSHAPDIGIKNIIRRGKNIPLDPVARYRIEDVIYALFLSAAGIEEAFGVFLPILRIRETFEFAQLLEKPGVQKCINIGIMVIEGVAADIAFTNQRRNSDFIKGHPFQHFTKGVQNRRLSKA